MTSSYVADIQQEPQLEAGSRPMPANAADKDPAADMKAASTQSSPCLARHDEHTGRGTNDWHAEELASFEDSQPENTAVDIQEVGPFEPMLEGPEQQNPTNLPCEQTTGIQTDSPGFSHITAPQDAVTKAVSQSPRLADACGGARSKTPGSVMDVLVDAQKLSVSPKMQVSPWSGYYFLGAS